jgi:hypothetical protein
VGEFKPGQWVQKSGVYHVHHKSHRLMHKATLLTGQQFPCCRQCDHKVRFELDRAMRDSEAFPFHAGEILKEYSRPLMKPRKLA